MLDLIGNLWIVISRSVVLFFVTLIGVRIMGKRSIAQLAPFDLAVIIIIGSLAALPLEESSIPLINGVVPIFVMVFLQYVLSVINLHFREAEKITQGTSTPIVINGQINKENMKKEHMSQADLYIMLRQQGVSNMDDIALATLEPTGQISVILKKQAQPVTVEDINLLPLTRLDAIRMQSNQRTRDSYHLLKETVERRNGNTDARRNIENS